MQPCGPGFLEEFKGRLQIIDLLLDNFLYKKTKELEEVLE